MASSFSKYTDYLPEKISVLHKVTEKTEKRSFHLHEQVEIVFTLSDNLKVKFEDRIIRMPAHSLLFLDSYNLHYIFSEEGSGVCDRYVLYFDASYISDFSTPEVNLLECFLHNKEEPYVLLQINDREFPCLLHLLEQMEDIFLQMTAAGDTEPEAHSGIPSEMFGADLHLKLLTAQFLLVTIRMYYRQYGRRLSPRYCENAATVARICEYIKCNYRDNLSAAKLATLFSLSKTGLYNLFNEVFGITAAEYIADYRITRAKDMLLNTNYSVEMISDLTGYSTISAFSRVFKAKTGISPLQYRKQYSA